MPINTDIFIHESDKAALTALKAIPGFTPFIKAFMKMWNERQMKLINMSTNLKLGPNQMPQYYNMLLPICEKLGIDVPDLYLSLDVFPNASTYGDAEPYIVITSGLLEMMPDELIPTILAHECGHIACHHVLYRTMGSMICNGAINIPGFGDVITMPLQIAFSYWMRCSELSADRVAAVCDNTGDKVIESMMRFAGYDKDIHAQGSVEEFLNQANEYKEMVKESKYNKMLEFVLFKDLNHPMNAVRALECKEFAESENFGKIIEYLSTDKLIRSGNANNFKEIPCRWSQKDFTVKPSLAVRKLFQDLGFEHIDLVRITDKQSLTSEGDVVKVLIDGKDDFKPGDWIRTDAKIEIEYYHPLTLKEMKELHPNEVYVPRSYSHFYSRNYQEVMRELQQLGFKYIVAYEKKVKKLPFLTKDYDVINIEIGGQRQFKKETWFSQDAQICLTYQVLEKK